MNTPIRDAPNLNSPRMNQDGFDAYYVPADPMDELQCDSCQ